MASKEQFFQKQRNISQIVSQIRADGKLSRADISKKTGLSWGCVSELVAQMIKDGVLIETRVEVSGKGRNPQLLEFDSNKVFVGVDVNAIGVSVCLCDFYGTKILEKTEKIDLDGIDIASYVIKRISNVITKYSIVAIGVAMQGIYDIKTDEWSVSAKQSVINKLFVSALKTAFQVPVIVEHDPNCILFGFSSVRSLESLMAVRIDSGIGVSIYKDGKFFDDGKLELGYMIINGKRLRDVIVENTPKVDDGVEILRQKKENLGQFLGVALGNLCNLISVDRIVLCGNFTKYLKDNETLTTVYENAVIPVSKAVIEISNDTDASCGVAKLVAHKFPEYQE